MKVQSWDLEDLLCRGYRYALALTRDEAAADDVLQDAWVSVLRTDTAHTPGILFRAIRSRFVDRYRRSRLVVITPLDDFDDSGVDSGFDSVIAADTLERILGELRPAEREAIYLSAVEGYTHGEIAELTDSTEGAVRIMLFRCKRKLREAIAAKERRWAG